MMRIVFLTLFLLQINCLAAQTEVNVIGSMKYFLAIGTEPRVLGADRNDDPFGVSLSAGGEAIFRGEGKRSSLVARMEYGVFSLDRLTNDFLGMSLQEGNTEGQLVGLVRFQNANYLQGALAIELIPPEQVNNINLEFAVGGMFILREQLHGTTTWVDPTTGIAAPATGGIYRDEAGRVVNDVSSGTTLGAGNLVLSQNMLRRFTPFAELNVTYRSWWPEGFTAVAGIQVGLRSMLDTEWYNTTPKNGWWVTLKGTFRGRII